MKRIFCFSLFVLLFVGCQQKTSDPVGNAVVIEVPKTEMESLEDIAENFRYITLKHGENADAMLGAISKLRVFRERIYVLDLAYTNKLLIFDKEGHFLKKVSRTGRGPAEYGNIASFEIDIPHEELLLKDNAQQKILIFDLDGNYKRSLDCRIWGGGMAVLPNGNRIYGIEGFRTNEPKVGGDFKLILSDGENRILEKYCENKNDSPGHISMLFLNPGYDGTATFAPQYMESVYRISEQGVEHIYRIHFSDRVEAEELARHKDHDSFQQSSLSQKTLFLGNHADSEDYFCFSYEHEKRNHTAYYNKRSGTTVVTTNALYGKNLTFDEAGVFWGSVTDTDLFFSSKSEKALEIREAIEASGNPAVVCYTLK